MQEANYSTSGGALPELSRRRRYLVLAICCLSLFIVGLDATIVNVALPATIMVSVLAANLHGPLRSGFAAATRPGWWIVAGAEDEIVPSAA